MIGRETRYGRVFEDVISHASRILIRTQNPIEEALLPRFVARDRLEVETCNLLEALNEPQQVRRRFTALQQDMQVVWHEAVGEQRELKLPGAVPEHRFELSPDREVIKDRRAFRRRDRYVVHPPANVVLSL